MNKDQFEHTIRAAGSILDDDEVLVIGSQAIHASINFRLEEAERSIEVDVSSLHDTDGSKADLIDGSIGELSIFQDTFGYYAQGVTPQTATLPSGWRKRLIPYLTGGTNGITALCLEPHDLWISKAIAGRPKDREFCRALLARNIVDTKTLNQRLKKVPKLSPPIQQQVSSYIRQD
ncbi:MAG: hypothetical protein GY820_47630 [Gammaproteobacteria bacterium]|nr:hypothetical protein [Gammaproteobacteria bacterium]